MFKNNPTTIENFSTKCRWNVLQLLNLVILITPVQYLNIVRLKFKSKEGIRTS